jgi:hypothetical protein
MKGLKAILMLVLFSGIVGIANAQVVNIPASAKEHFMKNYSTAQAADWSNNVSNYTVRFKSGGADMRAHYRQDGTWNFTETMLTTSDIPKAVNSSSDKSRFSDWEIVSVAKVDNDNKEQLYRIEAKKGIAKEFVFYNSKGKEIKTAATL